MASVSNGTSLSEALYQAAGKPGINKPVPFEETRQCGNCQRSALCAPAKKVLTSQFGSWGDIASDPRGGRWLCLPCAWAYRNIDLRRKPTMLTSEGMTHPTATTLRETLLCKQIPASVAVIIPVSGKRVVLPRAQWGKVTFDGGAIEWTRRDYTILNTMVRLREHGVGERELLEPSPPIRLLMSTDPGTHGDLFAQWQTLDALRNDKVRAPLFLALSRKEKA